jgi:CitMHS family citrate-Mg2+:H+ or citrate-Ca2+:H+ symporter
MLKPDYADNQRFTQQWSVINGFILLGVSLLTGIFPLYVR